jgi:hypothetical protein
MAAANESQGLKIAVAAFIALTVILTVTCYFLYSAYAAADAQKTAAQEEASKQGKAASIALNQYEEVRGRVGTKTAEYDQAKEEIGAHFKKIDQRLDGMINAVNTAVGKAQAEGAQGTELEETKQRIAQIAASMRSEPNKAYISSLDRAAELMENLALLSTELSLNYVGLRKSLESATSVSKTQIDVQTKAAEKGAADVLAESKKHEEERGSLVSKVGDLQAANDKQATDIANLTNKNKQQEDDFTRQRETMNAIIREQRDTLEKKELILDRPDGYVTYVDYERREVLVDLNRRQGARPQMKFTIFDAASPGIPTEKPKGNIELIAVGDQFSSARIIKTDRNVDPIRIGDIVYSAAWSPNQPMRFALVGKIDVNRDSKDDRAELKRMIQEAGGTVDFDLPPADLGKETGVLSPRIDWYVTDDRIPLRDTFAAKGQAVEVAQEALNKRVGAVIKEARLNGIRPMTIERLLAFLGYDMNTPVLGRVEAVNDSAMRRLTSPRHQTELPKASATGSEPAAAKAATKPAAADEMKEEPAKKDEPKDEAKKEEPKKDKDEDQ